MLPGGLAQQPMGYLADGMRVRAYARAKEAVEREDVVDGKTVFPAPDWAHRMVQPVLMRVEAQRQGIDLDAEGDE